MRWHGLVRFVLSWALRRRPIAETEALLAAAQSSQADARRRQEVIRMSETILQSRDQEMWAGGRAYGQLQEARNALQTLLEAKFCPLPEGVPQQIEATDDLERLRQLFRRGLAVSSLADLDL